MITLLFFSRGLLPPVLAGIILSSGLRPALGKFPLNRIRSPLWRVRCFVFFILIAGATATTYIVVSGARGIVRGLSQQNLNNQITEPATPATRKPSNTESSAPLSAVERLKALLREIPGMDAEDVTTAWTELLTRARDIGLKIASSVITNAPSLLVEWIVFILTFVFVSLSYQKFLEFVSSADSRFFPGATALARLYENATQATLLGTFVAGFCQASVVSIGMAVAGFGNFFLLGLLAFFASFLPFIGVGLVWGSALLYSFFSGNNEAAVIILITGCLSSVIDNLVMPTFVGSNSQVHPLILFVVILGAVDSLGVWGLFVGPVVAIVGMQVVHAWLNGRLNHPPYFLPEKVQTRIEPSK